MTKKTPNSPLDVVTALMQERSKFETWIATLEARRDATPKNVYERVRADYEKRLAAVLEELQSHAEELEAQAERYTARLAELMEQEQTRRDARAEAELRAHVGELSAEEWDSTAKEADEALAALAAEQAVIGADLNRVHDLLGAARAKPAAPAAPAAVPEPAPAPEAAEPAAHPSPVEAQAPVSQAPKAPVEARTPEQTGFDELAFLKSVVSPLASQTPVRPAPSSAEAPPTRAERPAAPARPESGPQITQDQTDMLAESLQSRADRPSQERAYVREDADDAASGLVGRAQEPDRPYAANVSGNHPIVLRPSGAVEQPKTLKCGECGAMNYPTEWYCERCGAELASL